jgi:beta-N-acetylhexosaminidase
MSEILQTVEKQIKWRHEFFMEIKDMKKKGFMQHIGLCFFGALIALFAVTPCSTVDAVKKCDNRITKKTITKKTNKKCDKRITKKTTGKKTHIIVGFNGQSENDEDVQTLKKALVKKIVAGFILYPRNIVNPKQLQSLIAFLKKDAPHAHVCIDQEGGTVERLKTEHGFTHSGAMLAAADYTSIEQARQYHERAAKEMKDIGITWVLGPVADVNINPNCPIIGQRKRSFSDNPEIVAQYCNAIIDIYKKNGLKACLKHAPGHGSSLTDSHLGFTDTSKTWIQQEELIPFCRCVKKNPDVAIMMAHVFNDTLDPKFPASMSKKTIDMMNDALKKVGVRRMPVYMADAYEMKAISNEYTPKKFLERCKKIGMNYVFIFCQDTLNAAPGVAVYKKGYSLKQFLTEDLDSKF